MQQNKYHVVGDPSTRGHDSHRTMLPTKGRLGSAVKRRLAAQLNCDVNLLTSHAMKQALINGAAHASEVATYPELSLLDSGISDNRIDLAKEANIYYSNNKTTYSGATEYNNHLQIYRFAQNRPS